MKYIVFCSRKDGLDYMSFVLFPEQLTHADMAEALIPSISAQRNNLHTFVAGAGFVNNQGGYFECFGHSESLEISSRLDIDNHVVNSSMLVIWDSEHTDEWAKEYPYTGPKKCGTGTAKA